MTVDVERILSEHTGLPGSRITDGARTAAKVALLDTVACMIAGLRSPECRALREIFAGRGGAAESSVVGEARRIPAPAAALCNAAQAHWYEWDDLHDNAIIHASAVIWPALLATAEAVGDDGQVTGDELLAAAVVAYDIAARIGNMVTPFSHLGWYATAPGGAVGAAAGAARLRRMSEEQIRSAMGLAAAAAGLARQPLIDRVSGKNALCAQTVSCALNAVDLAHAGVVGARNYVTGAYGFNVLMSGAQRDIGPGLSDLGARFAVEEMSAKPFPCCRAAHPSIDLALQLRTQHPGLANDVESIRLRVPQPIFDMVGAPFVSGVNPRVSAQFSIPYTVSVALLEGRIGLSAFDVPNILGNTQAAALAANVAVDPFPLAPGQGMYDMPTTLSCTLRNGAKYSLSTDKVKGSPQHPMTAEERLVKLRDCARELLSDTEIESLQAAIVSMEENGIAPAMSILRAAGSATTQSSRTIPATNHSESRIAG